MHLDRRRALLNSLQLFDLLVIGVIALLSASALERIHFRLADVLTLRVKLSSVFLVLALMVTWHLVFRAAGLYQSRRLSTRGAEIRDIGTAVTVSVLLLGVVATVLQADALVDRVYLGRVWLWSAGALVSSRVVLRTVLAALRRRGRNLRHVLIVGTNQRATQVAMNVERKPELGYRVIGFADDQWSGLSAAATLGLPVRTDLTHLSQFLRDTVVDEVFVCLPLKSHYERIRDIVERCESQGIIVRLLGRLFDLRVAHATADTFGDEAVVSVYTGRMGGWPVVAKRGVDIIGSAALLALLSPVFLFVTVAIRLSSKGPTFFVQERIGVNKRVFRVLKFRTMVMDAEERQPTLEAANEASGPVFKIRNDPRITPLGRLLRKTSVDELPQLVNVLKGDMSLVGPRPLPTRDYNGFDQEWHRRRFSVRPGMTCLWQVNGRSALGFDRWMELDMEYIDRWSLWLDLKILMKTVPAVLKGSGAA